MEERDNNRTPELNKDRVNQYRDFLRRKLERERLSREKLKLEMEMEANNPKPKSNRGKRRSQQVPKSVAPPKQLPQLPVNNESDVQMENYEQQTFKEQPIHETEVIEDSELGFTEEQQTEYIENQPSDDTICYQIEDVPEEPQEPDENEEDWILDQEQEAFFTKRDKILRLLDMLGAEDRLEHMDHVIEHLRKGVRLRLKRDSGLFVCK